MSRTNKTQEAIEHIQLGVDVRVVELKVYWLVERPKVSLTSVADENVFEFTEPQYDTSLPGEMLYKANAVLAPFLKVGTPEEGLQFLSATGYFLWSPRMGDGFRVITPGFKVTTLTWTEFQRWQELIRQIIESEVFPHLVEDESRPDGIYVGPARFQSFRPIILAVPATTKVLLQGVPHVKGQQNPMSLSIEALSTIEAILASLCADGFASITRKICARKGCGRLVVQRTSREKLFCTQKCAHRANMALIRKETPEERKKRREKGKLNG